MGLRRWELAEIGEGSLRFGGEGLGGVGAVGGGAVGGGVVFRAYLE